MTIILSYGVFDIAFYVILMVILWTVIRYFLTLVTNLLKKYSEGHQKIDPFLNDIRYPMSAWTERGGRPYQEDRFQAMKARNTNDVLLSLFGVFDGHGGEKAAQYCKDNLLQKINNDSGLEEDPKKALIDSFFRVDAEFSARARLKTLSDGTTAVVAVVSSTTVYVANAGDSRAVLVQKGGKIKPLSDDHRPDRKDEELRIRKLGGKVLHWGRWRVEGVLAVSRAIGDVALQPYVTCEPEIVEKKIEVEDEYVVLASDGIYDVISNEELGKLVIGGSRDFLNIAKTICTEAILLGSTDNVTVLVIDLKRRYSNSKVQGDASK